MTKKNRIFLIRHGQASWGKRNYDVLSDVGIQQAHVLGNAIKNWPTGKILPYSGTLERHRDTAKYCLQSMGLNPQTQENPDWNEFDFKNLIEARKPMYRVHSLMVADLALRPRAKQRFKMLFDQALKNWVAGVPNKQHKETWDEFKQRVLRALEDLKSNETSEDIYVFTSGGVISVIICHLLGLDDSQWMAMTERMANTSVTQLNLERGKFSLVSINEQGHLRGEHKNLLTFH